MLGVQNGGGDGGQTECGRVRIGRNREDIHGKRKRRRWSGEAIRRKTGLKDRVGWGQHKGKLEEVERSGRQRLQNWCNANTVLWLSWRSHESDTLESITAVVPFLFGFRWRHTSSTYGIWHTYYFIALYACSPIFACGFVLRSQMFYTQRKYLPRIEAKYTRRFNVKKRHHKKYTIFAFRIVSTDSSSMKNTHLVYWIYGFHASFLFPLLTRTRFHRPHSPLLAKESFNAAASRSSNVIKILCIMLLCAAKLPFLLRKAQLWSQSLLIEQTQFMTQVNGKNCQFFMSNMWMDPS